MYNKHSLKATEFIDDEEIKETLCFAQENKHNKELISSLIERAADCKGLTHREAAVLLECDLPEENEKMFTLAKQIKQKILFITFPSMQTVKTRSICLTSMQTMHIM